MSPDELRASDLYRRWWYYSIELLPDVVTQGIYRESVPMLPRVLLRSCNLSSASCLDMGTMEGLIPTLMVRGGASDVLAIDAVDHCVDKLEAVKHYYGVEFDYRSVGLMYDLAAKLHDRAFDLINCSGLLYHVFSPLLVLAGVRALLKRNGLLIVSTNVIDDGSYNMEFNRWGRLQCEENTFWYISIRLLDYLLRYLKLAPIDCLYLPHSAVDSDLDYVIDKPSGYLAVTCRAVDNVVCTEGDDWMARSVGGSWEHQGLIDWARASRQPLSSIAYAAKTAYEFRRSDGETIDLVRAITGRQLTRARRPADGHLLALADRS